MTDIPALIERARKHADVHDAWDKFELGMEVPPPLHRGMTALCLREMADVLSLLTTSPPPEEVAGLASALKKLAADSLAFSPELAERTLHWKAAAALERMARVIETGKNANNISIGVYRARIVELEAEIERLRCRSPGMDRVIEVFDSKATANQFLREDGEGGFAAGVYRMAKEIERLNVILGNHGVIQLEKTEIMLNQAARIAELEADLERKFSPEAMEIVDKENTRLCERIAEIEAELEAVKLERDTTATNMFDDREDMRAERDAIKAATVQRILLLIPGGTHCDPQEIADSIRSAFAKPSAETE
jgi:hypothetical protein